LLFYIQAINYRTIEYGMDVSNAYCCVLPTGRAHTSMMYERAVDGFQVTVGDVLYDRIVDQTVLV